MGRLRARHNKRAYARDPRILKSVMSHVSLFIIMRLLTPTINTIGVVRSEYMHRALVAMTVAVFKLSMRSYREKLGCTSFGCLVHTVVGQYLILTSNPALMQCFLKDALSQFIHSHLDILACFVRLQVLSLQNALAMFLNELTHVRDLSEAQKLASWFYNFVTRELDEYSLVKGRFVIAKITVKHYYDRHLLNSTLGYIGHALCDYDVKRIYVIARGRALDVAEWFDGFMPTGSGLTKRFEAISLVSGKPYPSQGITIAYDVQ